MKKIALAVAALAAASWLGGCAEVKQEPGKSYAGKEDTKAYDGDLFRGDKAKWETALASRSQSQNDYSRMPPDKK